MALPIHGRGNDASGIIVAKITEDRIDIQEPPWARIPKEARRLEPHIRLRSAKGLDRVDQTIGDGLGRERAGLVGKVSEVVGDDSSIVILLSDEVCQVSARIEGTTEQGILIGQRGALSTMPDLKLRYLSKNAVAPPGRLVITSGAGGLFPENLLLGRVKSFKPGAINGEAVVEAAINFDVLRNVFVILPEPSDSARELGEPAITATPSEPEADP